LTGRPPFPRASNAEKIRGHRKDEPPLLEMMNPQVPPAFAGVVRKMMAKSPGDRYPTAAAVRVALAPWAAGDAARPLDKEGDTNYQQALADLKNRSGAAGGDLLDVIAADEARSRGAWFVPRFLRRGTGGLGQGANDYLWMCVGVIGFWVVLLGVLGLVLWLR
jgi:hypothetical protein